jgi:hypothetical protein
MPSMLIKMNVILLSFMFGTKKACSSEYRLSGPLGNHSVMGVNHIMKGAVHGVIVTMIIKKRPT